MYSLIIRWPPTIHIAGSMQTTTVQRRTEASEDDDGPGPDGISSPIFQPVQPDQPQTQDVGRDDDQTARRSHSGDESGPSMLQTATLMTCLCACVFISALDITIVTTAMPAIANTLASNAGYTWIGTSFTLAHTASTPLWGKVSDIWGRRPILMAANAAFFAGSLACALVGQANAFIAGRSLQGLGAGGMQTIVNICISDMFSQRDRGLYYGLTSVVWALASGVGPVMGGVFTSELRSVCDFSLPGPSRLTGYFAAGDGASGSIVRVHPRRTMFSTSGLHQSHVVPVTGAVFVLLFFVFRLPNPRTPLLAGLGAIDWTGSFLIIGGALMLLLGLYLGGVYDPWNSATVVCLIVFAFVAGGLFVVNEMKLARYPVIPMQLFATWSSSAAYLVCFMNAFAFMGVAYYLPLYFQAVLLASPIMSGVYMLPFVVSSSLSGALTGLYIRWSGRYLPALYCGLAAMTLGIGLFIDIGVQADWVKLVIYQIIGGSGFGMNLEPPLLAVQTEIPVRDVAAATAVMGFTRTISAAISIVIGGVVFQNEMDRKAPILSQILSPDVARLLDGQNAASNVELIKRLPVEQQMVARQAFYDSTRSIWILVRPVIEPCPCTQPPRYTD